MRLAHNWRHPVRVPAGSSYTDKFLVILIMAVYDLQVGHETSPKTLLSPAVFHYPPS
jgi:hypothetical protein